MPDTARPASLLRFAHALLWQRRRRTRPAGAPVAPAGESVQAVTVEPAKIHIPVRESAPDASDRARLRLAGRHLARQEDWETLAEQLREADTARATVVVTRSVKSAGSSPRARARFWTRRARVRRSISVEAL